MAAQAFQTEIKNRAIAFKHAHLGIYEKGTRPYINKNHQLTNLEYDHILPARLWEQTLWHGIRQDAINYFTTERIQWHGQCNNLLSSQVLCLNIFFPFRTRLNLITGFLKTHHASLKRVTGIEFEYTGQDNYFHESGGRGQNMTSADVVFFWEDNLGRRNITLTECKFTEQAFGECGKSSNPDRNRCNNGKAVIASYKSQCYRSQVGRLYWDMILAPNSPIKSEVLYKSKACPFRYDLYQLMRNQLLAHCLMQDKQNGLSGATFAVCHDARNTALTTYRNTNEYGTGNTLVIWKSFLKEPGAFGHFTYQDFMAYLDSIALPDELKPWRAYLNQRYGL